MAKQARTVLSLALGLAVRDVTATPARVRICGTIISPTGKPTYRQAHSKTEKSTRVVSVPSFTAEVIRQRLVVLADEPEDHLLFFSRIHTPLTARPDELITGVHAQMAAVQKQVGFAPVRGALCFVGSDWPLFAQHFLIDSVLVAWPRRLADHLRRPAAHRLVKVEAAAQVIAAHFPSS